MHHPLHPRLATVNTSRISSWLKSSHPEKTELIENECNVRRVVRFMRILWRTLNSYNDGLKRLSLLEGTVYFLSSWQISDWSLIEVLSCSCADFWYLGLPVNSGGDQNVRYFCAKQLHTTVISHDVVEYLGSFCMTHYTVCLKCSFRKKYKQSDFVNMQKPSRVNVELLMGSWLLKGNLMGSWIRFTASIWC